MSIKTYAYIIGTILILLTLSFFVGRWTMPDKPKEVVNKYIEGKPDTVFVIKEISGKAKLPAKTDTAGNKYVTYQDSTISIDIAYLSLPDSFIIAWKAKQLQTLINRIDTIKYTLPALEIYSKSKFDIFAGIKARIETTNKLLPYVGFSYYALDTRHFQIIVSQDLEYYKPKWLYEIRAEARIKF
jgi:hypothetical protein